MGRVVTTVRLDDRFTFELPAGLEAGEPPEARGVARDQVRMLTTYRATGRLVSGVFGDLTDLLDPGDVVVINTSGTIPGAVDASARDGSSLVVHLSTHLGGATWIVEPRRVVGRQTQRWSGPPPPRVLALRGGGAMTLDESYGEAGRLWTATIEVGQDTLAWLETHGRPIRYGYVERTWPIETYQNVYANEPGSAEMPSAGRPFTHSMITSLVAKGVEVAPLVLHAGVSSLEADELPYPERVRLPATTAERVNHARRAGGRVIAVGTTAVRALESAADSAGRARALSAWTDLVIAPGRDLRLVDGLVTGWHEPVSSHLLLLEALLGRELLADSYHAALVQGYRWHEFGDIHLILP
jgi:S-adenosylmethionine:tRNA ribosyltransferase-isomerase